MYRPHGCLREDVELVSYQGQIRYLYRLGGYKASSFMLTVLHVYIWNIYEEQTYSFVSD